MKSEELEIPVQINGKTKLVIHVPADETRESIISLGKEALGDRLRGTVRKEIYVPGKILNLVVQN